MNTFRTQNSTNRNGVQLVSAFSSCSDDPKNNDGGYITGLAIDNSQQILAVDNDAGVVKVFHQTGTFKYSFGKGLLVEPWDIFITSSGKIAVSDPGAGDLKVFSHSGKYLLRSEAGFHLHEPYGVDYHHWTKETVVVDKMLNCVYLHAPSGQVKHMITKSGEEGEEISLKNPTYTSFDYAGNVYVTDAAQQSLHAYDPDLNHMFTYGHNKGDEDLDNPCGIAIDRYSNILVADRGHSSVHLLDKNGRRKLNILTWEDGIVEPQALVITQEGHLVLSEASTGLIKIFSYTHLSQVTEQADDKGKQTLDESVISNDDGVSLKSENSDDAIKVTNKTVIPTVNPKPVSILSKKEKGGQSTTAKDVDAFKLSLQMLTNDSADDYKQSLGYKLPTQKSGWSQVSSNNFSSVPSTAAPRGAKSSKQRLSELNKNFTPGLLSVNYGGAENLDMNGLSTSTPNIRIQSPVGFLADGGKHLSDFT